MKRRDLRGLGCAFLGLGLLIAAYPALAQTAAPPAAKPAATAAKPAAKPAAKKVVRWSRWRRPVRYRYSRWARPVAKKPATAWHPAAKPAWHPAYAAKPVAKPAWHPTYAAKPAAKPAWHPAYAAKPAAWTKPAQKPAAAAWHGATQAKQAAKITTSATAKPAKAVSKPAVKTAKKPVAKTQPGPLSMTRDANNGGAITTADSPIAGGGQMDMGGTVLRWIFWPIVVLLLVAGGLYAGRRLKLIPVANGAGAQRTYPPTGNGKGSDQVITPVFSNLGNGRPGSGVVPNDIALDQTGIGDGGLKIVGMQPLPGSGTTIYLVQIEDHLVLLGASQAGGVRTLAEWEQDNQPAAEKEKAAFDSFLRQQGIAAVSPREEEEHTFASIRARLNSTADRLAGLRADFGT